MQHVGPQSQRPSVRPCKQRRIAEGRCSLDEGSGVSKESSPKRELLENPLVNGVQEGPLLFRLLGRCLKKNQRVKRLVKTKGTERPSPRRCASGAGRVAVRDAPGSTGRC